MSKRLISLILVMAMVLPMVPVAAGAQTESPSVSNDLTLEAENSFGTLLSNTVSGAEGDDAQEQYDARICDLVVEGTIATVEYTTPVEANLVVAIYTEDGSKLLGSGTAAVSPEETVATVEIEIASMPYYFKAGAYLLDARNNDPVSGEFKTDRYTKTMQDILAATVDDFNPELVLNLDNDRTTNFAVFNEHTLLAEAGGEQNQITDNGNGTYTVANADERFLSMKPGDSFAYTYPDGTVLIVNAASVSVSGTTVTVSENADADLSNVFDFVKIEENSDGKEVVLGDDEPEEGVTLIDTPTPYGIDADIASIKHSYYIDSSKDGEESGGDDEGWSGSITGTVSVGTTVNLKLYISLSYQKVELTADFGVEGELEFQGTWKKPLPLKLKSFSLLLLGGSAKVHVDPSLVFQFDISLTVTISMKASVGFGYDSDIGCYDAGSPCKFDSKVEIEGKFFFGVKAKLGVACISEKLTDLSMTGTVGFEASGKKAWTLPSSSEYHECGTCVEGAVYYCFDLSVNLEILSKSVIKQKDGLKLFDSKFKLFDMYFSLDFNEFGFAKQCPHRYYKTTVALTKKDEKPIAAVPVQLFRDGKEVSEVYVMDPEGNVYLSSIPQTNDQGESVFYLANGEYQLRVRYDSQEYSKEFTIRGEPKSKPLTIVVDTPLQPASLVLSESSVAITHPAETKTLQAVFNGIDVTKACNWVTSDKNVVTVSNGVLVAVNEGDAVITATYTASGQSHTAHCNVTVGQGSLNSEACGDNLRWVLDDTGTLTISGTGYMYSYNPDEGSFAPWYDDREKIVQVVICSACVSIGASAFYGCSNLTSVTIPNSVTFIGGSAFYGCSSLTSVTIPDRVTFINDSVFYGCSSLTSVTIPDGVRSIFSSAFYGCSRLTSVTIPDSVTSIGWNAFQDCSSLDGVTIPAKVTDIGRYTFSGCSSLTSVTIPDGVTSIGDGAFYGCSSLDGVTIPDSVTDIGNSAFSGCSSLTSVTIPNSVTSIGGSAFSECSNLTSVTIPGSVTDIRYYAFSGCSSLTSVTIPDSVTHIGDSAFSGCSSLTSVRIPDGVTRIESYAFSGCSSLTSVRIPDGVTSIEAYTFYGCSSLTSVTIPDSVTKIWYDAFNRCSSLTDVYYLGTVEEWYQIDIQEGNDALSDAVIHCSDGTISAALTGIAPEGVEPSEEVTEPSTEPATEEPAEPETEPAAEEPTEPVTEPAAEPVTEVPEEPEAEPAGEPSADGVSDIVWFVVPEGAGMRSGPAIQRLTAFSGTQGTKNGMRTVKFTGLEPGEEYVLIVSIVPGSLDAGNLQYIDQNNAAADGTLSFAYIPREDVAAVVQLYGVPADRRITLDREYLTLEAGSSAQKITASVTPEEWAEELVWSAENPEGTEVISVNEYGDVTPIAPGTGYAVATVSHGKYTFTARCRVDVTAQRANLEVNGVKLGTAALTTELFRTDYAQFDVILLLDQNLSAFSAQGQRPEDNGVSVTSARFENEAAAARFDLAVKDDRTLLVVPRQTAIADPASVAGSYTSRVIVNVCGAEYVTGGSLKLTVKKSTPKLKATALTFNSFYTGQSQPILVTGGTVTGISRNTAKDTGKTTALPAWLTLSEGVLTLAADTPATASGKAEVLVETAEWAIPAALSVSVKLTRKVPSLKLDLTSVTIPTFTGPDGNGDYGAGQWVQLKCKNKKDTLESLNVSWIEAPEGWYPRQQDQNLTENNGWFFLKPVEGRQVTPGKVTLKVHFHDTDSVVELPLTVKTQHTPLTIRPYVSGTAYKLNSTVQDGFSVPWYVGPQYIDLSGYELTWQILDKSGNNVLEWDMFDTRVLDDGRLGVWTRPGVVKPGTYRLCMDLQDKQTKERKTEQSAVIPFTVLPEKEKPVIPIKVSNTIDLAFPDPGTGITFMKKNYFLMKFENFNNLVPTFTNAKGQDVTDQFTFERDNSSGTWVIRPRGEVAVGSYKLAFDVIVDSSSPNGTVHCSAKFTVKRTAIKLKLSKTSLSLNKNIDDWASVDVTCLTKGYDLVRPEISLMDSTGKVSAEGQLSLDYNGGKLTVATNEKTRYGETYKVLVRATVNDAAVTLTVKIPSLYQSTVSATLKTKGTIDVIRDSTSVTVTPAYKNYAGNAEIGAAITVFRSEDGKTYTTDVTSDFRITANENGSFTIARKPGISLDATRKYRVMLSFPEVPDSKSAYTALNVKAGKASVKVSSTAILYSIDRNSRGYFLLTAKDKTLNPISKVEFKNAKDAAIYEIYSYGDGSFAIGFKDAAVAAKVKSGSIPLNVFFEGSASDKPSTTVTLKLQIR